MQAQARSYTLDRTAAIKGSTSGYQRIITTGAYVGTLTKAKAIKASTGAEGLEFTFVADTGAEALMGKPVGVLLQREQYRKADGTVGEKMAIAGFFEADTRRSAREVLADTPVGEIGDTEAAVRALRDKLLSDAGQAPAPTHAPMATASATNAPASMTTFPSDG